MFNEPKAFLFTFTPYGSRLHGDERGSVDRFHNQHGEDFVPPNLSYLSMRRDELAEDPLLITPKMRSILVDTMEQHCTFRGWHLHAHNVRTNHIHAVISAAGEPARQLADLKSYLTRALRSDGVIGSRTRVWTEGGSTRYLFTDAAVARACEYVYLGQGVDLPRE